MDFDGNERFYKTTTVEHDPLPVTLDSSHKGNKQGEINLVRWSPPGNDHQVTRRSPVLPKDPAQQLGTR